MSRDLFSKRMESIPISIFSTISKLSADYKAVNLGQGFPDFDGPTWLMDEAYLAMKQGKNQYAPTHGIFSLRNSVSEVYKQYYGIEYSPEDEITITAGATEALYCAINALIEPGDEVIIFEPFYDSYFSDILLSGGVCRFVTLNKPDDETSAFSFEFDELESLVNSKTRMIILNNPHNPTGKVFSFDELQFIANIAIKNDLLVLSDEVYEFLTFDEAKHIPIATIEGMRQRTITISSTGKTFGMTGWKIGFACANPVISELIRKVHQWTTFAVNTPAQHAFAYAFTRLDEYLPGFRKIYTERRDLIFSELCKTEFKPHKPSGSYFIMADIPESLRLNDDLKVAVDLIKEKGIATIPPSCFYRKSEQGKTMLRLCFAKSIETIIEGISRLRV